MKKIAYLVLAHQDPEHLFKLLCALNSYSDIYVHLDKKVNIIDFKNCLSLDNVFFLKKRISVTWAGISMIDAQNLLMKEALKQKEKYYRCVYLSGSCYPIKNVEYITNYFENNNEFIKYIDMRKSEDHYIKQVKKKWFREPVFNIQYKPFNVINKCIQKLLNSLPLRNNWNDDIIPYFGSQWISLTIDCCNYIIEFQKRNPWFREMNKYTFSPDEHYYHTIVGNSEYAVRESLYKGRGTYRLANYHIVDKSLSKWFSINDLSEITNSDKLFVRKVSSIKSSELIDKLSTI